MAEVDLPRHYNTHSRHLTPKNCFLIDSKLTNRRKQDVLENNLVSLKYFSFWFELEAFGRAVHHQAVLLQSDLLPS